MRMHVHHKKYLFDSFVGLTCEAPAIQYALRWNSHTPADDTVWPLDNIREHFITYHWRMVQKKGAWGKLEEHKGRKQGLKANKWDKSNWNLIANGGMVWNASNVCIMVTNTPEARYHHVTCQTTKQMYYNDEKQNKCPMSSTSSINNPQYSW